MQIEYGRAGSIGKASAVAWVISTITDRTPLIALLSGDALFAACKALCFRKMLLPTAA